MVKDVAVKNALLRMYWFSKSLGAMNDAQSDKRKKQIAASVVLADTRWWEELKTRMKVLARLHAE